MPGLRIVVSGLIGQYPLGGVTWDYLQYVLGLARLGHDVYYLEETGGWPYNPRQGGLAPTCDFNIEYVAGVMERFGLEDRWALSVPRPPYWFGLPDMERCQVVRSADLLINVSGSLGYPERYRDARRMAYIDSDPVFTQLKLAKWQDRFHDIMNLHDVHFSFGERFSDRIPPTAYDWRPTRQPIVLSEWRHAAPRRDVLTTVMNWTSYKPIEYQGRTYGQKDVEFRRFLDLPRLVGSAVLEIAVAPGKTRPPPRSLLAEKGWHVVDPQQVCPDLDGYRRYIQGSMAEWSVAKNGYVQGRPGWFSCRSACYLAAGRPVIVQDTGLAGLFPVGEGILTFDGPQEAARAIRDVQQRYGVHAEAAAAIAEDHFDSDKVLTALIETAMNASPRARAAGAAS